MRRLDFSLASRICTRTRVAGAVLRALFIACAVVSTVPAIADASGRARPPGAPDYCAGCKPPLRYDGGAVLDSRGSQGLTVTPIYWAPPGAANQFPTGYAPLINRYIADAAAASETDTNVYSIATEYYNIFAGQLSYIRYHITAGSPVVDTRPLPKSGCKPDTGVHTYNACIEDGQLETELNRVLTSHHLPRGPSHFYPVFFPPGVQTGDGTGDKSGPNYCAYHAVSGLVGSAPVYYGNEPYTDNGCIGPQSPNNNPAADTAIDNLSHEVIEATTDPNYDSSPAWQDGANFWEIGDLCSYNYGPPLGSTDPSDPQGSEYNQILNGDRYHIQTFFSNYAYRRFGVGQGCQPSETVARGSSPPPDSAVAHMHLDATPHTLRTGKHASSLLFLQVWDKNGYDIPHDRISFTTYLLSGHGHCGTVAADSAMTDRAGAVTASYRASRSNVACVIVATDALGGTSVAGAVYQGKKRSIAPRASVAFPKKLIAGRTSTFKGSLTNPTHSRIADVQLTFAIYGFDEHSPAVRARNLRLSVSRHGADGPFRPVKLTGSTGEAGIIGVIGGAAGFNLRARHKLKLSFRIKVKAGVPRHRRRPIFLFQAYLGQVNPATGNDADLAATGIRNTTVR